MVRKKRDLNDPIYDEDLGVSTMAFFQKKIGILERRQRGSKSWERVAHEIRSTLLWQIACVCTDEQISTCAHEMRPATRAMLRAIVEPKISEAQSNLYKAITHLEENQHPNLFNIFLTIDQYWWPRYLAQYFEDWNQIFLSKEDLIETRVRQHLEPMIRERDYHDFRYLFQEIEHFEGTRKDLLMRSRWWIDLAICEYKKKAPVASLTIGTGPKLPQIW